MLARRISPVAAAFALLSLLVNFKSQAQWVGPYGVRTPYGPVPVSSFAVYGTSFFAGSQGVYLSSDSGSTWIFDGLFNDDVRALVVSGTNLFAGDSQGDVFLSTDRGNNWKAANTQWTASSGHPFLVSSLAVSGANLFAGTFGGGIFLSTDDGTTWTTVDSGLTNQYVLCLTVSRTNILAGTAGGGVFLSTTGGRSWTEANSGIGSPVVTSVALVGANLFAGTNNDGVYISTNSGASWVAVDSGLTNLNVWSLSPSGASLFAGLSAGYDNHLNYHTGGVCLSTDNGASWVGVSEGLPGNIQVGAIVAFGANLFAGTSAGLFRRPLSEMIEGAYIPLPDTSMNLPESFMLFQNYPNPFNPATTIRYSLPCRSQVLLTVYTTLGQQVATLVNETQDAGSHDVRFDGGGLADGMYFYRLTAGDYVAAKKLLLLR